ncbi:helix-turn-helix domain-containing protein [Paenibacillus endoradicis]|uniref:helix-turn-helix domain-containing protein n=1 Tax=Paenibacillus endoradicis TaxID=2972487 RepID=UPI00215943DE|nr:helix-turn-helix domain-containing protein [Paenibacillus endoradicis]MCR8657033.1 helix-turn-helix domain-containing protein [Paenibacillus endoradicis]
MKVTSLTEIIEKSDILERLDISIPWGHYEIRVLRFHLTSFPAGKYIDFHNHSEYEFHFIPRGKGKVILEDQTFKLSEGMFYLTGPGVMHYQEADTKEAMDEFCLHVDIMNKFRSDIDPFEAAEAKQCIEKLSQLPLIPTYDSHQAMECFMEAYKVCDAKSTGYYTSIRQLVISILLKSVRAYDSGKVGIEAPSRDMVAHRYQYAIQYIEANYSANLTLENVAEKLNISSRQLQRVFKHCDPQMPFSRVLEDIRMQAVCLKLEESDLSIEQIAQSEGFSNSSYLHVVFRKCKGMTPAAYRRAQQIK